MILVDTSVWIDHFRMGDPILVDVLEGGRALIHPFVIGELACGNLANRAKILDLLSNLPVAPTAAEVEVLTFIERHQLMGRGIGYIDVHLLAATALTGDGRLWTRDKRLGLVATEVKLAWPNRH